MLDNRADAEAVFERVEKILVEMGEIGTLWMHWKRRPVKGGAHVGKR
jgi:hypothetical protein